MSNNSSNIAIKVETLKEINIGNLTPEFPEFEIKPQLRDLLTDQVF